MLRYIQVKNELRKLILSMNPGDVLPSRPALCKKLDTTRMTLDKAIKELKKEQLLRSVPGSGTYVTNVLEGYSDEFENWCVIVPDVLEEIYAKLIHGIKSFTNGRGINLILCSSDNQIDRQESYIQQMLSTSVKGFVIIPTVCNDLNVMSRLYTLFEAIHTPFVFCNRSIAGINVPVISSNNFYGGYTAVKHLIQNGYSRIAFVSNVRYSGSIERCHGYLGALQEEGIEVKRSRIIIQSNDICEDYGYTAIHKLLENEPDIDAIFCHSDRVALSAYRAIKEVGLRVGTDIGVIGYNCSAVGETVSPALTSMNYGIEVIGRKAAEILWNMTHGIKQNFEFNYYLYQPQLLIRQSCLGPGKALTD